LIHFYKRVRFSKTVKKLSETKFSSK